MFLQETILKNKKYFLKLCRNHKVKYIYAFGSATNENFNEEKSDIDLLIEIEDPDPIGRGEKLLSLWDTFEKLFHRRIDLLTESSIKNPYLRKSIETTKVLIYDGKRVKIPG